MTPRQCLPLPSVAPARIATRWLAPCAIAAIATMMLASSGDAAADANGRSSSPYWKVGRLDPLLTQACRKQQFNQRHAFSASIGFAGTRGRGSTGAAQKDWNLDDPSGLARAGFTYHFFNDGLSDCTVFVAGKAAGPR
jgi:hypothetical protein